MVGRLELGLEGWKKSVEAVKKDQESMTGFAMRHGQEIQDLGKKFALAGAAITGALSAIVFSTAAAQHEFGELSEKTGISVEDLSTMSLMAKKSGTTIEAMTSTMKFLAAQMIETAGATDKSKTILGALGISATDSTGKLRPFSDILPEIADRFVKIEDPAIRIRLAVALFGRGAMDIIPVLMMGSKGFEENAEKAKLYGIQLSGPTVKAAEVFKDALVDLGAASSGLKYLIGETLMPVTQKFIEQATGAIVKVKDWAKENPELSKSILSFAGAGGIALTVVGTLLIAVGTLAKNLAILKIQAAIPIIITVGIAGGVALAKTLEEIRDFYEKNVSHKYIAQEDRDWQGLIRTLGEWSTIAKDIEIKYREQNKYSKESADIVGKLDGIWQKYGNSTKLAMEAILKGEAGPAVRDLLIKIMEAHGGAAQLASVHAAATDKVKEASKALDPALQAILDSLDKGKEKTKTLAEELNLTFTSGLKKRVEDIAAALKKYGDDLPESEVRRLKAEQREFNDQLITGGLVLGMVAQRLELLKNPIEVITAHMEGLGKVGAAAFARMGAESWVTVKEVESDWNDLYNNLTQGWASTLQSWFEGTLTFSDFLKETWGDMKEAFFTVIAQMVAEWTIKFVKRLITDAAGLFKDIGEFFSKLFKGIGEGAAEAGASITKNVADKLGGVGDTAGKMASSFLEAAGSIANIVTAVVSIIDLLAPAKKATDITHWLKLTHDLTQEIHDCLLSDYKGYFNDFWNFFYAIERHTNDTIDAVYSVKNAINDLSSFQHGGYVPETGLALLHAGEYVLPPGAPQGFVNAGAPPIVGGAGPIVNNYTISIQAIDGPSVEKLFKGRGRDIIEDMFRQNKKGLTTNVNKFLGEMM